MKAMIFAAGLGTRLRPLTDTIPKALVEINGKTLLEHCINKLCGAGFTQIIINIHHFGEQITDLLHKNHHFGAQIAISDERDCLLDTGGGLRRAAWFFDDGKPFLVHNVDILSNINLEELYSNHLKNNALATLVVSQRQTQRYFLFDGQQNLCGWTNLQTGEIKPADMKPLENPHKLAFAGIQVLSPEVLPLLRKNTEQKFSLTDFYLQNAKNQIIHAFVPPAFRMLDVGKTDVLSSAADFLTTLP